MYARYALNFIIVLKSLITPIYQIREKMDVGLTQAVSKVRTAPFSSHPYPYLRKNKISNSELSSFFF
jgi:hypothetical protein